MRQINLFCFKLRHSPSHTHYYCLSLISLNFLHVRMTSCHPTPTSVSTRRREHLGTLPYSGHLQYGWRKNPEKFQHQIRHFRIRELSSYRSCSCVLLMVRTAVSNMMQLYYRRESSTSCPETPIPALKIRTTMIRTAIVRLTTSSPSSVRLDRP